MEASGWWVSICSASVVQMHMSSLLSAAAHSSERPRNHTDRKGAHRYLRVRGTCTALCLAAWLTERSNLNGSSPLLPDLTIALTGASRAPLYHRRSFHGGVYPGA